VKLGLKFTAGRLVKGKILFELETGARRLGLAFECTERKGWLESDLYIEVSGEPAAVNSWHESAKAYLKAEPVRDDH